MGGSSKPNFPSPPEFQEFPTVRGDIEAISGAGRGLIGGDFLNPDDPNLGFLAPLTQINPEATQAAVGLATRDVERLRDRAQQDILNQLEANNQLTSSTAVNRLSSLNEEFSAEISDIATQFYLADVERALANTGNLFQLGLGATEVSAGLGQAQQGQQNAFALERFDREVSLEAERFSRQLANEAAEDRTIGFFAGPVLGPAIGGIRHGGRGAQSGLQGGLDQVELGLQAFSTFSGFGGGLGGGSGGGLSTGSSSSLFPQSSLSFDNLSQRDLLNAQRVNKGFGFNTSGGLA